MERRITSLAIGMLALTQGGISRAEVIYNSQSRTVSASAMVTLVGAPPSSNGQSFAAPDFGPFFATATAAAGASHPTNGDHAGGSARASQSSTLSVRGFSAAGTARCEFVTNHPAAAGGSVSALSRFEVEFVLDSPAELLGRVQGGHPSAGITRASLLSNGSTIASWSSPGPNSTIRFALEPGTYTFWAETPNSPSAAPAFTTWFQATLTTGAVGDMNCDGAISVGDIAGFVLAITNAAEYEVTYPDCDINNADVNFNGSVSVGDIGIFVQLVAGG